jgi:hypothetical protein
MLDRILIGSSAEPSDPNFKNVTLLLHGDGSNGAQNNTFLDSSTNNLTITRNGNTTQGSFSPYGSNWSNYFDGSGDYLSAPSNTAFDCGTGDWTFEAWVFISTRTNSYPVVFGNNRGAWTTDALALTVSNADNAAYNDKFVFGWNNGGFTSPSAGTSQLLVASSTNSNNTWYHFAVVRNGTSIRMYRDGVQVASATVSAGATFNWGYNGALLGGGNWDGAGSYFNGYISNARLVKGTAVYTSAFTPSTTPLTAITNTSLLTCQSNRFRDASTNNFTITRNGDVKVTNFAPFAPSSAYSTSTNGGSAYFDGSGDYLTSSSSSALGFGTGDFTIELWFYTPAFTAIQALIDLRSGAVAEPLALSVSSSGLARSYDLTVRTGGQCNANQWNHIAWVRASNVNTVYVNGVVGHSWTNGADYGSSRPSWIGMSAGGSSEPFTGYISNLRVVKGTAVYTAAFTPPTAPVTAITNTSLLTNFTNAAIFDNSMKNDLETAGNAQISTSVKKFGTGSMAFDGNGDYLYPATSPNLAMGTGNFTVEGWIYATGTPSDSPIFECRSTGSATDGFTLTAFSSSVIRLFCGSALISSSSTSYVGQWVHLAVARVSGTTTFYINGTSVGSTASTINWTNQDVIVGGGRYSAGSSINVSFTGYIDDFRITKGVARYTANFTPPTAAFPNK